MFCKFCGTELLDNAIFCKNCGKKQEKAKNQLVDYSSLSLREEIKHSKMLCLIHIVYFIWGIIFNLFFGSFIANFSLYNTCWWINQILNAIFFGVFTYTCSKRSIKFSLICLTPYLILNASYPFYFEHYDWDPVRVAEYVGFLILPLIILWIIRLIRILTANIKSIWLLGITTVSTAGFLFFMNYCLCFRWISSIVYEIYYPLSTYVVPLGYVLGIIVSNILMHIIYKAR